MLLPGLRSAVRFLLISVLAGSSFSHAQAPAQPTLAQQTQAAVDEMQNLYTPSTGLYQGTNWWPSANELTTLADYATLTHSSSYNGVFANTLHLAPNQYAGFLDGFYDDEGWWALAWVAAYDVTGNQQYLSTAESIFTDMTGGWSPSVCGGGIWWDKAHTYKNAIANELFLSVAAHLANRTSSSDRANYLGWANQEWTWFHGSGLINSQNLINDGLTLGTCQNNGDTTWSYNQGVILGGLVELNKAQPSPIYLATANTIAQAAITHLTDANLVLHDAGEPNLGADGPQFKGVFLRNLMALTAVTPNQRYADFSLTNAQSVWYTSRNPANAFGQVWTGPFDAVQTASQGSATDSFVAALSDSENPTLAALPDFTLSASPSSFNLKPGGSATATVTLSAVNGFSGASNLRVEVVHAPAGVTASLGSTTLTPGGQASLNIETTGATPGGTLTIGVIGSSGTLLHTTYVQLLLPDFSVSTGPANNASTLYLNQSGTVKAAVQVNPLNGFTGNVALSIPVVPPQVGVSFSPAVTASASQLTLSAGTTTPTSTGSQLAVSGSNGSTTHAAVAFPVAISAGLGECGLGDVIDLSGSYNLTAIHTDGTNFTDGGIDGAGYALSSAVLTGSRVLNGIRFQLGAPDVPDAVYAAGQTIALPQGHYRSLQLMGIGVEGRQANQLITVAYTDGSTTQLTPSFSDWFNPQFNVDEGEAIAMPYREASSGKADNAKGNAYGYTLLLDHSKTVKSMTLPQNRDVVLLAATLSDLSLGAEVNLAAFYNATAIATDGTTTSPTGGVDGGGYTYSANLLNDLGSGEEIAVGSSQFHLATPNVPNVVYAAGQTISLPTGLYTELKVLGAGVNGEQAAQTFTVNFADGTSQTVQQGFSDWFAGPAHANESPAVIMSYRNNNAGAPSGGPLYIYLYTFPLQPFKPIKSITLPNNRNLVLFSMTLAPPSLVDLELYACPVLFSIFGD